MLQACLNGARPPADHPAMPVSPEDLAAEARRVRETGAVALHVHPRNDIGAESLAAPVIAAAMRAIRQAVPGMPVGVATGAWVEPDPERRTEFVRRWGDLPPEEKPDYASVNLSESGAAAVMSALTAGGIGIEAGVWSVDDAHHLARLPQMRDVFRILIEIPPVAETPATKICRDIQAVLAEAGARAPVLLHGEGISAWPMLRLALAEGLDSRIGLEDTLSLPDGTTAPDNAALIAAAVGFLPVEQAAPALARRAGTGGGGSV